MHNGLGGASAQNITILQRLEIAEQAIYKITEEATANEGRNNERLCHLEARVGLQDPTIPSTAPSPYVGVQASHPSGVGNR